MKNRTLQQIILGIAMFAGSCKLEKTIDNFLSPNYSTYDVNGILTYVADNISYSSDKEQYGKNYFAPPQETFENKKGDCEDFSILDLYLLKRDLGIEGSMVVGIRNDVEYSNLFEMVFAPKHAWIEINNVYYESQSGGEYSFDDYIIVKEYTYEEIMEKVNSQRTDYSSDTKQEVLHKGETRLGVNLKW